MIEIVGPKKKNVNEYYIGKIIDVKGQLELSSDSKKPHYQIYIEVNRRYIKLNY